MDESTSSFKIEQKSSPLGCVLKLLISTAGGRFPRALLEPPCASHSGVSRLMGLTIVRPTEDLLLFPQESPPAVPINDAALRINEGSSIPANGICETPGGDEA